MVHPVLFYRPGERLSLPELTAARLDGHVVEVGDGYMPADTVEGADARATSIAHLVPARTAACRATAAWVLGAGDRPPTVHHVRRAGPHRVRMEPTARVVHHDAAAPADGILFIAGVAVTSPLTTAVELVFAALRHPQDERWLRALLQVSPGLGAQTRARLQALPRMPGRRMAIDRLELLLTDQDVVTR